jgi:hypothetical protein
MLHNNVGVAAKTLALSNQHAQFINHGGGGRVSILQIELHPSQFILFQSSHCSHLVESKCQSQHQEGNNT